MAAGRGCAPLPAGAERTKLGRGISSDFDSLASLSFQSIPPPRSRDRQSPRSCNRDRSSWRSAASEAQGSVGMTQRVCPGTK